MTAKKLYDWQTVGGTDDVMRLVDGLARADIPWCAIGGVAVNHWAAEPMVAQDVNLLLPPMPSNRPWTVSRKPASGQSGSNGQSTLRDIQASVFN